MLLSVEAHVLHSRATGVRGCYRHSK